MAEVPSAILDEAAASLEKTNKRRLCTQEMNMCSRKSVIHQKYDYARATQAHNYCIPAEQLTVRAVTRPPFPFDWGVWHARLAFPKPACRWAGLSLRYFQDLRINIGTAIVGSICVENELFLAITFKDLAV